MKQDQSIRMYFAEAVHDALDRNVYDADEQVERYLADMLVEFLRMDSVYGVKDKFGEPVSSVTEMLDEGDIRLNADSFSREREVHRHIGDFLLFWSGLFPEYLKCIRSPIGKDALLDPVAQGKQSYRIASTFEFEPYLDEAKVLKKLSEDFENYRYGLTIVRAGFEGFRRQGWIDGFQA